MGWWMVIAWIVSVILTDMARPKIKPQDAIAAKSDEVNMPTASATKPIAVIWGKWRLRDLNLVWYGDYLAIPIRKKIGKGGFLGTGGGIYQTVGYKYYWGQHLGLCHGKVTLHKIWSEEREIWSGTNTGGNISIDNEALYGGEEQSGGLVASIKFYPGDNTHMQDSYLTQMLGEVPGYRGVASLLWLGPSASPIPVLTTVWEWVKASDDPNEASWIQEAHEVLIYKQSGYIGTSPTPRPISVEVSRYPQQLTPSEAIIGEDCNPIEMIYECLTTDPNGDDGWGMGISAELIDKPSFVAAAHQCYTEGLGISLEWSDQNAIEELIKEVCKIVDATCFRDFRTGKWTIKLMRGGYNVSTLPVLDVSNIREISNYVQSSIDGTINEVKVNYTDRAAGYKSMPAQAQDLANMRSQGEIVSSTLTMKGVTIPALADRLANRELLMLSSPLAKADLIVNRQAYTYGPGDLFILNWEPLGISNLVVRVTKSAIGMPNANRIRLSIIQDIFQFGQATYMVNGGVGWVEPISNPLVITTQKIIELPYCLNPDKYTAKYALCAKRPSNGCSALTMYQKLHSDVVYNLRDIENPMFTPTAVLNSTYGITSSIDESGTLVISGGTDLAMLSAFSADLRELGSNLFAFETGEWCSFRNIVDNNDGTYTLYGVWRGLFHTTAVQHLANERVWFYSYGSATADENVAQSAYIDVKGCPFGPRGAIGLGSASLVSATMQGISARPYTPGDVRVNGSRAILSTTIGDANLTWTHRRRHENWVASADSPGDLEPEGSYIVVVKVAGTQVASYEVLDNYLSSENQGIREIDSLCYASTGICVVVTRNNWQSSKGGVPARAFKVSSSGPTNFVGSTNAVGLVDGSGATALFDGIRSITKDTSGNFYVLDNEHYVRKITPAGVVTTLYNLDEYSDAGYGLQSITMDPSNNLYFFGARRIFKITPAGAVSELAGSQYSYGVIDGTGSAASFSSNNLNYLLANSLGGIFVVDMNDRPGYPNQGCVRYCTSAGVVTTIYTRSTSLIRAYAVIDEDLYYVDNVSLTTYLHKLTPAGVHTSWAITSTDGQVVTPDRITRDPNGFLFFTSYKPNTMSMIFGKINVSAQTTVLYTDPGGRGFTATQRLAISTIGTVSFQLKQITTESIGGVLTQFESETIFVPSFTMTGLGMTLGQNLGGLQA